MSAQGRVLVTGASGFVGSAVVRAFLAAGYPVRALVRAGSSRANLDGLNVECVQGDIRDESATARAMRGITFVVHAAADYRLWAKDPETIAFTNVEGTRTVMQAALAARVERIVHTSSVATLAPRADGEPADESSRVDSNAAVGAYKKSKVLAERLVEAMVAERGLPAVIVQPSTPVGPRDIRPTPTGQMIVAAASGQIPGFVDTGLNLLHVDDAGTGHVMALQRGAIGERYILGGENVLLSDMLRAIAALAGRRAPRWKLPRAPLYPLALGAQIVASATGRAPLLTLDGLRMSRRRMFFSAAKAQRELGFRARPYGEALRDAVDWFRRADYLR